MPVIQSAIKRAHQAKKRTARNKAQIAHMRSLMKNIMHWTKSGEKAKAEQMFAETQKAIDTVAKKHLIHDRNAARKKALLARAMNAAGAKMTTAVKVVGKEVMKKAAKE